MAKKQKKKTKVKSKMSTSKKTNTKKSKKTKSQKKVSKKIQTKKSTTKSKKKSKALKGVQMSQVNIGDSVKDFELEVTGQGKFKLSTFKGKKVLLFFYPKDATPGCTIEGHEFTKLKSKFNELNVEVFGVSRDSLSSHEKFKSKQCYTVDLISDPDEELCLYFGVMKLKNMYGKQVRGIERSTFLVDESGKLQKEWRGVKAEGHAQAVLAEI